MSLSDYLALNGTEIVNNARVEAYSVVCNVPRVRSGVACDTLAEMLGDTYVDPATDGAPWYDAARPESADFAGFLCLSMAGLDNALFARSVTDLSGDGATFGTARRRPRTIVVSGWLLSGSCCATAYGLQWYGRTLAQVGCDGRTPCPGSNAMFYNCCPTSVTVESEPAHRRTLHRVSLVDGINIIGRKGNACGNCGCSEQLNIEFTIVAGDPYAYRAPTHVVTDLLLDGEAECVQWTLGDCEDCVDVSVATNPDCPPGSAPPRTPTLLPDCGCYPIEPQRTCIQLGTYVPAVGDLALLFSISADDSHGPIHNAVVTLYQGADCDSVGVCDILQRFIVSYVPQGETVTVDAAERTVTVTTATGEAEASALVIGAEGAPFAFPIINCSPLCLCVDIDGDHTGATLTVAVVGREV